MKKIIALIFILFSIKAYSCQEPLLLTDFCTYIDGFGNTWYEFYILQEGFYEIEVLSYDNPNIALFYGDCPDLTLIQFSDISGQSLPEYIEFYGEIDKKYFLRILNVDFFQLNINNCNPLPVQLLSFKLYEQNSYIKLLWSTASETNNRYFSIYSSEDFNNWKLITQVPGAGNSNSVLYYSCYDDIQWNKKLVYYKLTQTDYDGEETILGVLPLMSKKEYKTLIKETDIKGNPVKKEYNGIRVKVYSNGTVEKVIEL